MAETHPEPAPGPVAETPSGSSDRAGSNSLSTSPGRLSAEAARAVSGVAGDAPAVPGSSLGGKSGADDPAAAQRSERTWTVLIAALGGEGGGVLSNWLVDAAAADGRTVQATSVPGVAQRTGATTYYLEIGARGAAGDTRRVDGNDSQEFSTGAGGDACRVDGNDSQEFSTGAAGDVRRVDGNDCSESSTGAGSGPAGVRDDTRSGGAVRGEGPESGSGAPVMALLPTPGNVDLLVASELLEAGRAAQTGMITPDRTTVIASTHRTFAIAEKSAMGDGRFNDERIQRAVRELSRRHVLTDLGKVAERAGTVLSSVLLGAVAASGALPIPGERLRAAIERSGIAVEANLRGFDAGCRLFDDAAAETAAPGADQVPAGSTPGTAPAGPPASLAARVEALPEPVREFARLGVERTVDYQDVRYGALYLDRIERLLERTQSAGLKRTQSAGLKRTQSAGSARTEFAGPARTESAGPARAESAGPARAESAGSARTESAGPARAESDRAIPESIHAVAREVARQLALWMCFEDIVRVADLKTRRSRFERVRSEVRAKPGQPVVITEFLKPGVDEWCSLLPAWLARPVLRAADRGGWRRRLSVGLHVRTSTVTGFLLLWTLARLRWLRRGMYRYREEQERIETWLDGVGEAQAASPALALEAAKCANLVKGYGDTRERGVRNFERTMGCLTECTRTTDPPASLRILREAALADPDGGKLDAAITAIAALGADAASPGD